jgi:hypothetical protein
MASWVVLEAPPGASTREGEELVFQRDGFSVLAFLFPPIWLLWHRLWVEAIVTIALLFAVTALERFGGLVVAASFLSFLVSLFVGLEGNAMRIARWQRRGWRVATVVDADSEHDAETIYAAHDELEDERPADRQPIVPHAAHAGVQPSAVGLLLNPGR